MRLTAAGMLREVGPATGGIRPVALDPNRARLPELMVLPGIGRQRAEAIVLHRVRHGPFRCLDDLLRIDGIGPATLAAIRPHLLDPAAAK